MPRRFWPRKDAYGGDTRRVGAINLLSGGFRMEQSTAFYAVATHKNSLFMGLYSVWRGTA